MPGRLQSSRGTCKELSLTGDAAHGGGAELSCSCLGLPGLPPPRELPSVAPAVLGLLTTGAAAYPRQGSLHGNRSLGGSQPELR